MLSNSDILPTEINEILSFVDFEIPERDYDDDVQGGVKLETSSAQNMMENPEDFDSDENAGSLTPEQIRSMMSREQKDLQRDLKIMHKRYSNLGPVCQRSIGFFFMSHHASECPNLGFDISFPLTSNPQR